MRFHFAIAFALLFAAPLGGQAARSDSTDESFSPLPLALLQPSLRERSAERMAERMAERTAERMAERMTSDSVVRAPVDTPSVGEVFGRVGAGTLGAGLGAIGAGLLGYAVLPHSDCNCDDPGLDEFLIGAAVGSVAGAALASALPRQRSQCSYGKRVMYGLAGALAGGALGLMPQVDARVIFVPVGAAIGSGVASAYC